jgi:hypothetical protein
VPQKTTVVVKGGYRESQDITSGRTWGQKCD